MACRQRASENSSNRRRRLILEKGFELARYQKDTALGECILNTNVKEDENLQIKLKEYDKQTNKNRTIHEQKKRFFDHERDVTSMEPTILIERNQMDMFSHLEKKFTGQPRYMRQLSSRMMMEPSDLKTFQLFKPIRPRKANIWEPIPQSSAAIPPVKIKESFLKPAEVKFRSVGAVGWPLLEKEWETLRERDNLNRSHSAFGKTAVRIKKKRDGQHQLPSKILEPAEPVMGDCDPDTESVFSQRLQNDDPPKEISDSVFITQWKPVLHANQLIQPRLDHETELNVPYSSLCKDSRNIEFLMSCIKKRPKSSINSCSSARQI